MDRITLTYDGVLAGGGGWGYLVCMGMPSPYFTLPPVMNVHIGNYERVAKRPSALTPLYPLHATPFHTTANVSIAQQHFAHSAEAIQVCKSEKALAQRHVYPPLSSC